jgi:hypothetical protein
MDNEQGTTMAIEMQPFEQDFLLVTETEMRVRQATQYARLDQPMLSSAHEAVWEWDDSTVIAEQPGDQLFDQQCASVWESILERL